MKKLSCFLLICLPLIQCQKDTMNASLQLCSEVNGVDTTHYACLEIHNSSNSKIYLNNFTYSNYLQILDENGTDILTDFLIERRAKYMNDYIKKHGDLTFPFDLKVKMPDSVPIENANQPLLDIAVSKDFERVKDLNRDLKLDTVFIKAIHHSLSDKYKNAIYINPNESFKNKIDISILIKSNRKFSIFIDYPQEKMPAIISDYLYSDSILDGRNDKIYLRYPADNIEVIDGYIPFKGRLKSNKIVLNNLPPPVETRL